MDNNLKKYKCNQFDSWLKIEKDFNLPINLYVDDIREPIPNEINIAYICEPQVVYRNKDFFIKNKNKYNVILTFNDDVLRECENSEFFEFGTCWVKDNEINENKEFSISFLVGGKSFAPGHRLRHEIWDFQNRITIPKKFFNSTRNPYYGGISELQITDNKGPLFDSQFHICIENSQENNYFSEKLIDCLYSKTIPIYWGCPNINKWFNMKSIFIVNNLEELIQTVNSLNNETYESLKDSINENFEKCKNFLDLHTRLEYKIEEIINRLENEKI